MKNRVFTLFLIAFLSFPQLLWSQTDSLFHVVFSLHSPDLPDSSIVYIAGSIEQLGEWDPGKVNLQSLGNHNWKKEITETMPMTIEYKYTLGSWEREGADTAGLPLSNLRTRVTRDTTISDTVLFWTNGPRKRVRGQITGVVRYHRGMKGAGLRDRDIIVWLPPDYDKNKNKRYPVVYMHDGQNIFDPATSAFGVDWAIDETVDSLIKIKKIQPVIVVGIYNTADRMKEYIPGEKGTAYMNFLVDVVKPFIDSTYRTKQDRANTIVGGSSAGGVISLMLVWEHPDVFSKAICMSPAFKRIGNLPPDWNYITTVRESKQKRKNVFFYLDNGGIGIDTALQEGVDEMLIALNAKGYKRGRDFVFIHDTGATHFEADWAKRFPKALMIVLGKK
jgi:predicted alpha/beta superfamily hydrolase